MTNSDSNIAGNNEHDATSSFVQFACPGCDAQLKVQASMSGNDIKCPKCERVSKITTDPADSGELGASETAPISPTAAIATPSSTADPAPASIAR